ncbi:MAG: hypothetical protein M3421_01490 [Bacteroidota bacterium]|nr:hypothetical protein [Bacteroidota bacterium]
MGEHLIVQMKDQISENIDWNYYKWLQKRFTLISTHKASQKELTKDIYQWLMSLSFLKSDKAVVKEEFWKFF